MSGTVFKKATKEQRERLRARRAEGRDRLRSRTANDTVVACYLYVGGSDGHLTPEEIRVFERELKSSRFQTPPSLDSLSRKIRSFLSSNKPSLQERRRLLARLREFALCDGGLASEEEQALSAVEQLLRLSPEARKATRRAWGTGARPAKERVESKERGDSKTSKDSNQWKRSRASTPEKKAPLAHWSYEYLGCSEQDTDETIKKCYRRLAVKLHPDKHAAHGATPEETLKHIRAFQKLQEAYYTILKLRRTSSLTGRRSPHPKP